MDSPDAAELVEAAPALLWATDVDGQNAFAHGFPNGCAVAIWIGLSHEGQEIRAAIGRDGAAAPAGEPKGLGIQVVEGICREVGARRRLEGGRASVVSLPLERG